MKIKHMYLTGMSVSVIDGDTLKVTNGRVGSNPSDIAVDNTRAIAYVANLKHDRLLTSC
jgi:DNA-binding beta-propeller fold protein YncE